jgi:Mrp family chromosome partitioning ATPase
MTDVGSGQPPPTAAGGIGRLLRARIAWILAVTFVVSLSAAVFSLRQAPVYSSTARVVVVPEVKTGGPTPQAPSMGTEKEIASSEVVVSRAAAVLDVPVAELQAGLTVTVPVDANILDFKYASVNAEEAQRRAQQLALSYVEYKDSQPIQTVPERASIITKASLPSAPVQPNTPVNVIAGLVVGLVLGFLTALVRDRLDDRVRGPGDLEQHGFPVLAVVPPTGDRTAPKIVVVAAPDSAAAQVYGMLGEKILLAMRGVQGATIAVTSAVEDEGKSSVAANLATALALGGKRVVLIGADVQLPHLDSFGFDDWPGVLEVLAGRVPLSAALQPTRVPGLRLLTVGPPRPGAPTQVVAAHWADLVADLRRTADLVVVGAAPLLASADSLRVIQGADAVVISIGDRRSTRSNVERAAVELRRAGARVLGCVVTEQARRRWVPRRRRHRQDEADQADHQLAAPASMSMLIDQQHLAEVRAEPGLWDARRKQENGYRAVDPQLLREGRD